MKRTDCGVGSPGHAHRIVSLAVQSGTIPKLDGTVLCVDCGCPASGYDHRDYDKPLEVEPVCYRCNQRRGPAKGMEPLRVRKRGPWKKPNLLINQNLRVPVTEEQKRFILEAIADDPSGFAAWARAVLLAAAKERTTNKED